MSKRYSIKSGLLIFGLFFLTPIFIFSQESKKEKKERDAQEKFDKEYNEWKQRLGSYPLTRKEGIVTFEFIDSILVKGKTKGDLVVAFKTSLSDVLKEAKSAIDIEDKDAGLVIAKVTDNMSYEWNNKSTLHSLKYSLKFLAKEDKFRLQLTDIAIAEENTLYYSVLKVPVKYSSLDPQASDDELKGLYKKLSNKQREFIITVRKAMVKHLGVVHEALGLMIIKKTQDTF